MAEVREQARQQQRIVQTPQGAAMEWYDIVFGSFIGTGLFILLLTLVAYFMSRKDFLRITREEDERRRAEIKAAVEKLLKENVDEAWAPPVRANKKLIDSTDQTND
jgi:flagellar biosynthesis/type III secretory pathway M-ring protein FliF/YscJ